MMILGNTFDQQGLLYKCQARRHWVAGGCRQRLTTSQILPTQKIMRIGSRETAPGRLSRAPPLGRLPQPPNAQPGGGAGRGEQAPDSGRTWSSRGGGQRGGIGSYAAKLQQAQQRGQGTQPDQVNRLHPQAISQLREQTGAGASGEGSWYEGGDDPMDVPNARPRRQREQAPQARSWVDDEYMGEPEDDEDDWGVAAGLEDTLRDTSPKVADIGASNPTSAGTPTPPGQGIKQSASPASPSEDAPRGVADIARNRKTSLGAGFKNLVKSRGEAAPSNARARGTAADVGPASPSSQDWLYDGQSTSSGGGAAGGSARARSLGSADTPEGRERRSSNRAASSSNAGAGGGGGWYGEVGGTGGAADSDWGVDDWYSGTNSGASVPPQAPRATEPAPPPRSTRTITPAPRIPRAAVAPRGPPLDDDMVRAASPNRETDVRQIAQSIRPPKLRQSPAAPRQDSPRAGGTPAARPTVGPASGSGTAGPARAGVAKTRGAGMARADVLGFYKAADLLQQRLSLAVNAEVEEAKDAHFRQYKRRTVSQLRRTGVILVNLQATFDERSSELSGSDKVWILHLDERPPPPEEQGEVAVSTQASAEGGGATAAAGGTSEPTASAGEATTQLGLEEGGAAQAAEGAEVERASVAPGLEVSGLGNGEVDGGELGGPMGVASAGTEATEGEEAGEQLGEEEGGLWEGVTEVALGERSREEDTAEALSESNPELSGEEAAAAEGDGSEADLLRRVQYFNLPEHSFKKGDPLLILKADKNGNLPPKEEEVRLEASMMWAGKDRLRIAVSNLVHAELLASPDMRWRLDKTVQETTAHRQQAAISMLDKPHNHLKQLEMFRERKARARLEKGGDDNGLAEAEIARVERQERDYEEEEARNRELGKVSKLFKVGEWNVRQILVGSPDSERLAKIPPSWISNSKTWRDKARAELAAVCKPGPDGVRTLNKSQIEAIAQSLCQTCTLWQGPPGTGKTRTLLALLEVLSRMSKVGRESNIEIGPVLACADTNAATDNILEGLHRKGVNVIRLGRNTAVRPELVHLTLESQADAHIFGQQSNSFKKKEEEAREELREFMATKPHGGEPESEKLFMDFDKKRKKIERRVKNLEAEKRKWMDKAKTVLLDEAEVVTATCAGAGDLYNLQFRSYRVVVIDEATQSTEPSTLIPLLRGAECVIMAGDPKQLPPTVISDAARECSLDQTLFERLLSGVDLLLLDTQYRMHPAIANIPNKLFYDGLLKSGISADARPPPLGFPWPNPDCPVALVDVDGEEQRGNVHSKRGSKIVTIAQNDLSPGARSLCNREEALYSIRCLEMLMTAGEEEGLTGAILTPYNAQARLIKELIKVSNVSKKIVVSSVDGYQGREADVIVFSAVRNNDRGSIGFVADERRLNVAITRPRRGLVVVGNPDTLSSDHRWLTWMNWVRDQGGLLSPEALLLTQEEKQSGRFDPDVSAASIVVQGGRAPDREPVYQDW